MEGGKAEIPSWQKGSWHESPDGNLGLQEWEHLTGQPYQEKVPVKGQYTMESTVLEMRDHVLADSPAGLIVNQSVVIMKDGLPRYPDGLSKDWRWGGSRA